MAESARQNAAARAAPRNDMDMSLPLLLQECFASLFDMSTKFFPAARRKPVQTAGTIDGSTGSGLADPRLEAEKREGHVAHGPGKQPGKRHPLRRLDGKGKAFPVAIQEI